MQFRLLIVLLSIFLLSNCAKLFYPDSLCGEIRNGTYTTTIGRAFPPTYFNILIPQSSNLYELHYLVTQELYGANFTLVSFGPVATDETVYRIMVVNKKLMPLEVFKDIYFPYFIDLSARGFNRQMFRIYEDRYRYKGHDAIYEVYTQKIPGFFWYYGRHQQGPIILTHAVSFIDYGCYGVIFWIQTSTDSAINQVDRENRPQILNHNWWPQERFIRSFVILQDLVCAALSVK